MRCVAIVLLMLAVPARAQLRLHPDNPRYLQDLKTGKPVLILGYDSIVPTTTTYDWAAGVAKMTSWRLGYARVWHLLPWEGANAVWPWARSATPGAYAGGNKFDFDTFDSTYFARLTASLEQAERGGVIAELHLFDRCGMSPAESTRWGNNPWASDNNINQLELPPGASDGTPEFYGFMARPRLRAQQERYVRKMIDETARFSNVIYEIENEHWDDASSTFGDHYARLVKAHLAATHPGAPHLVSYNSLEDDLEDFYALPSVDVVNKHFGGSVETDPSLLNSYLEPRWQKAKAINVDEFANGVTDPAVLRRMCWTIVTSGGHFHIEDADARSQPYATVDNLRSFASRSGWDFVHAAPRKTGDGFCMVQAAVESVCYFPVGGSKSLPLEAGAYTARWWNPRRGGFSAPLAFEHPGGARALASPDAQDWVLQVSKAAPPALVLESRPAGALTIDGDPADWRLDELTVAVRGGEPGRGTVGRVGSEGGACFAGGRSTAGEFPVSTAADHQVRFYSRHDAAKLYFLVRADDSDVQTPNATALAWANDAIEISLAPARLQLVIDA